MIRGALACELVSLSPESLGVGDKPSAGKRDSRRWVASAGFFRASQKWSNMRKFVCSQGHRLSLILLFNFLNLNACFLIVSVSFFLPVWTVSFLDLSPSLFGIVLS